MKRKSLEERLAAWELGVAAFHTRRRAQRAAQALEAAELRAAADYLAGMCDDCGRLHTPAQRQAVLQRADERLSVTELLEMYPCTWGDGPHADRKLWRDLKAIGRTGDRRPWWWLSDRRRSA